MGSQETLLIASLAFCFGLALIGAELGISAAAGAFIIGVILGDTPEADQLRTTMRPVQDMFGAIFFVSIGMLVDLSSLQDYLVPALVITGVFILGKIIANTIGSFMVGLNNRSAVRVGMAMPQLGEFSLAIGRVGSEAGVVGAFVYPVLTATTVLTAVVYPHIYRSAEAVGRFLETRTPKALREYAQHMALWTGILGSSFVLKSQAAREVQHFARLLFVNLGLIAVIVGTGTFFAQLTENWRNELPLDEDILGLIIGISTLALCIPPFIYMWKALRDLSLKIIHYSLRHRSDNTVWAREGIAVVLQYSVLVLVTVLFSIICLPLISQLISIGGLSTPLSLAILAGLLMFLIVTVFKAYAVLEPAFRNTFWGTTKEAPEEVPDDDS